MLYLTMKNQQVKQGNSSTLKVLAKKKDDFVVNKSD